MQSALGAMDVPLGARHGAMELPDSAPTPEERTLEEECIAVTRRQVRSALARLDVREREIIRRRHLSERTATLRAVAKGVGLSRERVRQLDARAQQKIREAVQLDLVA